MNTAHVSTFVLISILRGQPRTPPSGENLGALDYHLKTESHVVREQCNEETPKGPACDYNRLLADRDSWRVNTAHVSSFVLISILRGQPRTPPSGENLGVLDYHLNQLVAILL